MAITSFMRYEKKFLLSDEQVEAVMPSIYEKMEVDAYCKDGRSYTVYNIYYDTDHDDVIRESVERPYYKEKLRIRTYSLNDENAPVFLELKKKINGIVTKRRIVMTRSEYRSFLETKAVPDNANVQITNELKYYLSHHDVHPNVFLSYERRAFFGKNDPEFRLTIDKKILARRTDLVFEKGNYGEPLLPEGKNLMEVKFSGNLPLWLVKQFSANKIYHRSFSKYGTEYKMKCYERLNSKGDNNYVRII